MHAAWMRGDNTDQGQESTVVAGLKKILLVDDHAFLRDALAEVMARAFPGVQVLQAGDLQGADHMLEAHRNIDLLLLDLDLPDGDGLDALGRLRVRSGARLVVMSANDRPDTIWRALDLGASGYLPKSLTAGAMLAALNTVLAGGIHVPASALRAAAGGGGGGGTPPDLQAMGLSPRQTDVLGLLVEGVANKVIARELDIGEATVKTHLTAILTRFGVATRTQVVVEMARRGWRVPHRQRLSD